MGVAVKEAVKHAYIDIPTNKKEQRIVRNGTVYRITFRENIFDNVFTTMTYDYKTGSWSFGVAVKR